jgi:hypothetical protein
VFSPSSREDDIHIRKNYRRMKQNTLSYHSNWHFSRVLLLICAGTLPAAQAAELAPEAKPIRAVKIVLVGGSTTAVLSHHRKGIGMAWRRCALAGA